MVLGSEGRYRGRAPGCKRRLRFGALRRAAFLAWLKRDCNSTASARATGFHPSTVVQALRRDPKFARDNEAALERGYARLARPAARMKRFLDRGFAPTGAPARDFEAQLRLLARYRRPERAPGSRRALSFEESLAALKRQLRHLDVGWPLPSS